MTSKEKLIILLPPSEGKALSGKTGTKFTESSGSFGKSLGKQRASVIAALKQAHGGSAKLLGVSGAHLARAQQANLALRGAKTLPASQRYTGVVWDHLDLGSLPFALQKIAAKNIVIVSGLLGLVAAGDATPDYRLKIGASLAPMGKLSSWWRDELSCALNKYCAGAVVVNLLPQEHASAFVADEKAISRYLHVDLATKSGTAGGHDAKAAKGRLARHLLLNRTDPIKALRSFKDPKFKVRILEQF
ncbi:MAG: peroxide stress protein YaaA [Actinomycetota bacterium]|nr:peroxide stress protein YaaA [Actinomycetota bacterium]